MLGNRKETMRRWVLEMWGNGDLARVDELTATDYVYRAPGMPDVRGGEAVKELVTFFRTAFPDLSNIIAMEVVSKAERCLKRQPRTAISKSRAKDS